MSGFFVDDFSIFMMDLKNILTKFQMDFYDIYIHLWPSLKHLLNWAGRWNKSSTILWRIPFAHPLSYAPVFTIYAEGS